MNALDTPPVARRLPGAPLAEALLAQIPAACAGLPKPPRLVVVRVGDDAASQIYVQRKLAACAKVGIAAEEIPLPANEHEAALHSLLNALAHDADVDAMLLQLPLPAGFNIMAALALIPAAKDCDGLAPANEELRRVGDPTAVLPATPLGILRLLEHIRQPLAGRHVAVIGRGLVVGAPLREMLMQANASVIGIDRDTPHPQTLVRQAEIVVAACGVPHLITESWLKPGTVVIDVGLTRVADAQGQMHLRGDVDHGRAAPVASWLTPVPGGVGPLTVASLLTNIVDCARRASGMSAFGWSIPHVA